MGTRPAFDLCVATPALMQAPSAANPSPCKRRQLSVPWGLTQQHDTTVHAMHSATLAAHRARTTLRLRRSPARARKRQHIGPCTWGRRVQLWCSHAGPQSRSGPLCPPVRPWPAAVARALCLLVYCHQRGHPAAGSFATGKEWTLPVAVALRRAECAACGGGPIAYIAAKPRCIRPMSFHLWKPQLKQGPCGVSSRPRWHCPLVV
jgi:hypothetical protein